MKRNLKKIFIITYFIITINIATMRNVRAYIDPSVMTYAVQAIAGIAIAIGAAFGIYFRKAKKKINSKLGIDENKNKEVESDEIVVKKDDK
ncbi:MAG: hypothetical protein IJ565_03245 [Bacilli bacterium]|nr:hypothetical protein [Bacilli bacterium]